MAKFDHDQTTKQLFRQFLLSEDFVRTVFPNYKAEFFREPYRTLFSHMREFFLKYNKQPTLELLRIVAQKSYSGDEHNKQVADDFIELLETPGELQDHKYMVDLAEEFGKHKGVDFILEKYVNLLGDGHKTEEVLRAYANEAHEAIQFGFDTRVASRLSDLTNLKNYFDNPEVFVPSGFSCMDERLGGGFEHKTLTVFAAASNVGKTLTMSAIAAEQLRRGKKVLYVSLEMADAKIEHRIIANLSDHDMNFIKQSDKSERDRICDLGVKRMTKNGGDLFTKEYPTSSVDTSVIKLLLDSLAQTENFVPDIMFLDYINLINSARLKPDHGSYATIGAACEEMRGIAVSYDIPIVTATQLNRAAYGNSDAGLEHTSESMKLVHTADNQIILTRSTELDNEGCIQFNLKKSRATGTNKRDETIWKMGVEYGKHKLLPLADPTAEILQNVAGVPTFRSRKEAIGITFGV